MSQDRRDAMHWAQEWQIKQKKKMALLIVLAVAAVAVVAFIVSYVPVLVARTTYGSEAEMKAALQGRFETDYAEDIVIEGDKVTLTYYNQSHYDLEYAEKYGYSEYDDSVYEDEILEWDYRRGELRMKWMDTISVDKDGNLVYYRQTFTKTDNPRPTPIDPSELSIYKKAYEDAQKDSDAAQDELGTDGEAAGENAENPEMTEEEQAAQESQTETEAAAEDAGVEPLPDTGNDV